jgi:hypothetical protein
MRARTALRWGAVTVLAVGLPVVLPPVSLAGDLRLSPQTYVDPAGSTVYAHLRGTDRFRIKIAEGGRHRFVLTAKGHRATTRYSAWSGPTEGGRVSVDLGRLGGFHLRFVPVGKPQDIRLPYWCTGPDGSRQRGYLLGRGVFRGERDYTEARVHRVRATSESWSRVRCHYVEGGGRRRPDQRRAAVRAYERTPHFASFGAVLFRYQGTPPAKRVTFSAAASRQSGRVWIARELSVSAPEDAFTFPGGHALPEVVSVRPPAPFTGSATFNRTPESTFAWTGDLAVSFPGTGPVPLTGKGFGARVCRPEGCVEQARE